MGGIWGGTWGGTGASTALDNLASVAINTSLLSDTDVTDDLGSNTKQWRKVYTPAIAFPATQTTDANANTLDDYEEGIYTATLTPETSGTITLDSSMNILSYTKIGRVVHVQGNIVVASVSDPVGRLKLNLPFTATDLAGRSDSPSGSVIPHGLTAAINVPTVWIAFNTLTTAYIDEFDGTNYAIALAAKVQANTQFVIGLSYIVE